MKPKAVGSSCSDRKSHHSWYWWDEFSCRRGLWSGFHCALPAAVAAAFCIFIREVLKSPSSLRAPCRCHRSSLCGRKGNLCCFWRIGSPADVMAFQTGLALKKNWVSAQDLMKCIPFLPSTHISRHPQNMPHGPRGVCGVFAECTKAELPFCSHPACRQRDACVLWLD